jgi:hypothetical protein
MKAHAQSASTPPAASISLPEAEVIPLPTAKPRSQAVGSFTKGAIAKMRCPPGKTEAFFWDPSCRGLGIRALSSGRRSWVFQYRDENRRTRRIAVGDVSAVSLEAARAAARQHAAGVVQGKNPSVQRRQKRDAVRLLDVIEAYLRHAKGRQRPRSYKETERHLLTDSVEELGFGQSQDGLVVAAG